ncbi:MAG: FAD-binding protein, partial [Candidatus Hodarchaeota archaeon]
MDLQTEVLIIGGGMAGLVAGSIAAENGLKTFLLRRGQSATAYSSGAIDIIGYLPEMDTSFASPIEGLAHVVGTHPLHPYSILGFTETRPGKVVECVVESVLEPVQWLKEQLKDSCASLVGDFEMNIHPITVLGTTKPTCLVQESMWHNNLGADENHVLLFVGFRGHPDLNAPVAAKTFLETRMLTNRLPQKVGHCTLPISPFGKNYNISSIELARYFDHQDTAFHLAELLKPHVDSLGVTHVAVPPVLGIERVRDNIEVLRQETGAHVFELLSMPPSVPGFRLQKALDQLFVLKGGNLLVGHDAISYTEKKGRIESVKARGPKRTLTISTKSVVLATGKFISGGIVG